MVSKGQTREGRSPETGTLGIFSILVVADNESTRIASITVHVVGLGE